VNELFNADAKQLLENRMQCMGVDDKFMFLYHLKRRQNHLWNRLLKRPVRLNDLLSSFPWLSSYTEYLAQQLHSEGLVLLSSPVDGEVEIKVTDTGLAALASRGKK
jgi:hypothetical protein